MCVHNDLQLLCNQNKIEVKCQVNVLFYYVSFAIEKNSLTGLPCFFFFCYCSSYCLIGIETKTFFRNLFKIRFLLVKFKIKVSIAAICLVVHVCYSGNSDARMFQVKFKGKANILCGFAVT